MGISMELLLEIIDDFIDGDANEATEEYDCADTTQGVFKACVFFYLCFWLYLKQKWSNFHSAKRYMLHQLKVA